MDYKRQLTSHLPYFQERHFYQLPLNLQEHIIKI